MTDPFILVLTGSIGMGKSTTAAMFADIGIPVWDADAAVEELYASGGSAVAPVGQLAPQAIRNGAIDKALLRDEIAKVPTLLNKVEQIVHPLVAEHRNAFLEAAKAADIVVLDIPLFFESKSHPDADAVLVVSATPEVQRDRVLGRGKMDEATFEMILSRQVPDADKRASADYVIETLTLEDTRRKVEALVTMIRASL
ncbi:MAG: dephospho-CoA kinase [Pseudomonadota bacterium]